MCRGRLMALASVTIGLKGLMTYKVWFKEPGWGRSHHWEFGWEPGKKQYTHQPIEAEGAPLSKNRKIYIMRERNSIV